MCTDPCPYCESIYDLKEKVRQLECHRDGSQRRVDEVARELGIVCYKNRQLCETNEAQTRTIESLDGDIRVERTTNDRLMRERDAARKRLASIREERDLARNTRDACVSATGELAKVKEERDEAREACRQRMQICAAAHGHASVPPLGLARGYAAGRSDGYVEGRQAARKDIESELDRENFKPGGSIWKALDHAVPPEEKKPSCTCSTWGSSCRRCNLSETSNCHNCGRPQTLMYAATLCTECYEKEKPTPRPPQPHPAGPVWCAFKGSPGCKFCHPRD